MRCFWIQKGVLYVFFNEDITLVDKKRKTHIYIFYQLNFRKIIILLRDEDYYTVNPEFALIKIEHSFTAFTGSLTHSHRRMYGSLVDAQGKVIKRYQL